MRVKIIDEYNRIPTRTQSALLTVMGDNYAEILNHVYECPESAWFLTANDEQGGGTVHEALQWEKGPEGFRVFAQWWRRSGQPRSRWTSPTGVTSGTGGHSHLCASR